jgi:hypothetical protein
MSRGEPCFWVALGSVVTYQLYSWSPLVAASWCALVALGALVLIYLGTRRDKGRIEVRTYMRAQPKQDRRTLGQRQLDRMRGQ